VVEDVSGTRDSGGPSIDGTSKALLQVPASALASVFVSQGDPSALLHTKYLIDAVPPEQQYELFLHDLHVDISSVFTCRFFPIFIAPSGLPGVLSA
jgi:hypothetical protein